MKTNKHKQCLEILDYNKTMNLTQDQKADLKSLKNHPWYKILELVEKEASDELFKRLATFDLDNEKDVEVMKIFERR